MLSWRVLKWLVPETSARPKPSWKATIVNSRSSQWLLSSSRWCRQISKSKYKVFTVSLDKLLTAQVKKKSNKLWKWAGVVLLVVEVVAVACLAPLLKWVLEVVAAVACLVALRWVLLSLRCEVPQWTPHLNNKWWWSGARHRCNREKNRQRRKEVQWCKKALWQWIWKKIWWWKSQCQCKCKHNLWPLLRKRQSPRLPATLAARSVSTTRYQHNFSKWASTDESSSNP